MFTKRPKRVRQPLAMTFKMFIVLMIMLVVVMTYVLVSQSLKSPPEKIVTTVVTDYDTVLVPAPARQIARGEPLRDVEFVQIKFPRDRISNSYIQDVDKYKDAIAVAALPQHLPVPTSAVSFSSLNENAVVDGIPPGMRAITVRVDVESAVEGWARSGNYVDVILIRTSKYNGELEATIIASNVKILSAGRSTIPLSDGSRAPQAPQTVTLLTSQEDGLKIKAAGSLGKLTFALRGQDDLLPARTTKLSQSNIIGADNTKVMSKENIEGVARDSNGNIFVLEEEKQWVRAADLPESNFGLSANWIFSDERPRGAKLVSNSDSLTISQMSGGM